jgi:hypothetical protein
MDTKRTARCQSIVLQYEPKRSAALGGQRRDGHQAQHAPLFLLHSLRIILRIHKVDDKWCDAKDFNHIAGFVKAKVANLRRHQRVCTHLQLLQLGRIVLFPVCNPKGTL